MPECHAGVVGCAAEGQLEHLGDELRGIGGNCRRIVAIAEIAVSGAAIGGFVAVEHVLCQRGSRDATVERGHDVDQTQQVRRAVEHDGIELRCLVDHCRLAVHQVQNGLSETRLRGGSQRGDFGCDGLLQCGGVSGDRVREDADQQLAVAHA